MKTMKLIGKTIKYLFVFALLIVLVILISAGTSFKDLKAAGQDALAGKQALEAAANATRGRNWNEANSQNDIAEEKISASLLSLEKVRNRTVYSRVPTLRNQVTDLEYLLKTADIISRSLDRVLPILEKFDSLYASSQGGHFSSLSTSDKEEFFQLIYESEPELNGLRANLELAKLNLDKIRRIGVLWPVYDQISDLKGELEIVSYFLGQATPLISLLPALAGYPDASDFLFIMHNNDELRPSGGFIGVFGLMRTQNGDIVSLLTSDSYHLDMPAVGKWTMEPPMPIKKYMQVENWYLRDANWSPDWPTSALKIQEIFAGETKAVGQEAPQFTGVIGITPDFVSDLLALVGPITVNGETYTPENLQPLLQYTVEVAYKEQDISSWDRKDIINDLLAEMKVRLFALETAKLPELLSIFVTNVAEKDVQIYFNNTNWQSLVYDLGADGAVKKDFPGDYLLVVDANLGAFKSDAVVHKNINYLVNPQANQMQAELELSYRHEGGFDWRTTRYRSYTRVYAPLGSKLVSIKALGKANLAAESISSLDDLDLNKSVFGFFFSLEPGTEGSIKLEYTLPTEILTAWQNNNYDLLVQKQAGRRTENLRTVLGGQAFNYQLNHDVFINQP